ncbi:MULTISPECIES: helix-turn-helix domain-containing protein [Burkholderia cepacia complex]|uniref:helix-turn-helix domain-containing protein n=1 Tax=Burkholderia cepacia complex TaxID=87882 RepID=UPI00158A291D|nr:MULTISPECIES: helix-turn-helix domain-containing protein [Burkholderia cepacia complex]MBR8426370.1 helix-turn-helix domain-containing protein [Burkholderia cenocepacia]MBR8494770.1 helix-turn-helix domain-containing protein [Burkholderia cenocepacia]MCA8081406.1 helix-turn-helix domain-containing protein [Burkholderia cepacia]
MTDTPQHLSIGEPNGATLRALRLRSRRTQGQMAQLLLVTERQYQRWEAGETEMPLANWELLLRVWGARQPIDFEVRTDPTRGWDIERDTIRDTIEPGDVVELQPIVGPLLRATVCVDPAAEPSTPDQRYSALVTEFVGVEDAGDHYEGFRIGERVTFSRGNVIHLEQRAPSHGHPRIAAHPLTHGESSPELLKQLKPKLSINTRATGILHRAIVALPDELCEPGRLSQERVVFYEAPSSAESVAHLERLLAVAWGVDTNRWTDRGCIYNIYSSYELKERSFGETDLGELRLFEVGGGGMCGVGPDRLEYARRADVDLLVSPRVASRLQELLAVVEYLYAVAGRATAT